MSQFLIVRSILLVTLCAASSFASPGWQKQRTSSMSWFHTVFFVDQNRGWVGGSKGTLLSTTDGGKTWQLNQPTEDTIRDIYFADPYNGLIICDRNVYELKSNDEPRAYIMRTTDGGQHWKRVNSRGSDARLMRAVFTRRGNGWAFGEAGAIYTTQDGGLNWLRAQTPTRFLLLGGSFIDESNGWLVGAGSTILQTTDGGETWHNARLVDTNVRFYATSFVDSRLGWTVGSGGAIYRTINGGRSWRRQQSGVDQDLYDVKFFDALEGWAVGDEGTVLHTFDGGLHWSIEPTAIPHALERIFFTDRNHGWAVGFGGTIISYGAAPRPVLR